MSFETLVFHYLLATGLAAMSIVKRTFPHFI
jgi:hypothetical protein